MDGRVGSAGVPVRPVFGRGTLTTGRYTVTTRRIVVEGRLSGVRVRRSELLAELTTPKLLDDGSVAFGDPREQEVTGHRASGALIGSLVLHKIAEPERVLEIIREAQRKARE